MKTRRILLRFVVWNMHWMTRYLGFLARPVVSWMAEREVIACGFRDPDGGVRIIFSPGKDRGDHWFVQLTVRGWDKVPADPVKNFSGDIVRQVIVPSAQLGEVFRVHADTATGVTVNSPRITVKEETRFDPDLINLRILPGAVLRFSWSESRQADTMLHFLVVEDSEGKCLAAVYTRESSWSYPLIRKASLSIGPGDPPGLSESGSYTVKLVYVDFDGWVSAMAVKSFIYNSDTLGG
jgi:hypothetical protein